MNERKTVLVDMDGVLANFEKGLIDRFKAAYPQRPIIPYRERTTFEVEEDYHGQDKERMKELRKIPGFFLELEPIEGGVGALEEMAELADVRICTAPTTYYKNCVLEKYAWVERHLGSEWVRRIILTKDKTLVRGDYLIDDKPEITGSMEPLWEQVYYDQPYNRGYNGKKRLTWDNWREVLEL